MGGEEKGKKVINRKKETKENEKEKGRKLKKEMEERGKKKVKEWRRCGG